MINKNQILDIFSLSNKGYIFPSSYSVATSKKFSLSNLSAYSHLLLESVINQDTINESYVDAIFEKKEDVNFTINIDDVILDDVSATTAFYKLNQRQAKDEDKLKLKTKTTVVVENSNIELKDSMEKDFRINNERYTFLKWFQKLHNRDISIIPPRKGTVDQLAIDHLVKVLKITPLHDNKKQSAVRFKVVASNHSVANLLGAFGILSIQVPITEIPNILTTGKTVIKHPNVIGVSIYNALSGNENIYDIAISIIEKAKERGYQNSILEFQSTPYEFSISDRLEIASLVGAYSSNKVFFPMDKLVAEFFDMPNAPKLLERYASTQNLLISRMKTPKYENEISISLKNVPFNIILSKDSRVSAGSIMNTPSLFKSPIVPTPYKGKALPDGAILITALDLPIAFEDFDQIINIGLLAKRLARLGVKAKPWVKTVFNVRSLDLYNILQANGYLQALAKIGFSVSHIGADIITNRGYILDRKIEKEVATRQDLETAGIFSYGYNITRHYNDSIKFNIFVPPVFTLLYAIQGTANNNLLSAPLVKKKFRQIYSHNVMPTDEEVAIERDKFKTNLKKINYNVSDSIHNRFLSKTESDTMWEKIDTSSQADNSIVYEHQEHSLYFKSHTNSNVPTKLIYHNLHILGIFGDNITTDQLMGNFQLSTSTNILQNTIEKNIDINFQRSYNNNDMVLRGNLFNSKGLQNYLFKKNHYGDMMFIHEDENYLNIYKTQKNSPQGLKGTVIFGGNNFGLYNNANNVAYSLTLFDIKAVIAVSFDDIFRRDLIFNGILPVVITNKTMIENNSLYGYSNLDIILVGNSAKLKDNNEKLILNHKCIITNNQKSSKNVTVDAVVAIFREDELIAYHRVKNS